MIPALCCLAYPRASITLCYYNYNCWCSGIANMGTAMLKAKAGHKNQPVGASNPTAHPESSRNEFETSAT